MGEWLPYTTIKIPAGSFCTKKLCSRLYSIEIEFSVKTTKNRFLGYPLGCIGATRALHL